MTVKNSTDLDVTPTWSLLATTGDAFAITLLSDGPIVYRYETLQPPAGAKGHILKKYDTWVDQACTNNFWIRGLDCFAKATVTVDETTSDQTTADFTNPVHSAIVAACVTF
jgi:hypothetical protein